MTPLIDPMAIRKAASAAVFARGQSYFEDDAATINALDRRRIHATVEGGEDYQIVINRGAAAFAGTCTCPARGESAVCKHMVAAALAANALDEDERSALEEEPAEIAAYLAALPQQRLVAMLVELAETHEGLRRALQLAAAATGATAEKSLAHFRRALQSAARIPRRIDYESARGWAGGVETVLESLDTLIAAGQAGAAMTLAEEALDALAEAVERFMDSDGEITDLVERALGLHAKAARALQPEPLAFADRLLELALGNDYIDASGLIDLYDGALGEAGLAELERLALGRLGPAPAQVAKGRAVRDASGEGMRSGELTRLLDACAARRGDVDARVALRRRSLSSAYSYLEIVELLIRAGRDGEALDWAQEGLFMFESEPDERLVMAATALLDKAERAGDAEVLLAKAFVQRPSEALYAAHARRKSGEQRRLVTDRAIDLLETGAAGRGQPERYGASRGALIIAILTREERFAEAWAAVERHNMPLLASGAQQLAKLCGARHPLEASRVWRAQVDQLLSQGGNGSYEAAYALLDRLADLARAGGSEAGHAAYVTLLRLRHKAKRNFIRLFEVQPPISARRFAT